MAAALMAGCASVGVRRGHLDAVLVDVVAVHMMQVAVMQVVDVVAMAHGGVPT